MRRESVWIEEGIISLAEGRVISISVLASTNESGMVFYFLTTSPFSKWCLGKAPSSVCYSEARVIIVEIYSLPMRRDAKSRFYHCRK